MRCLVQLLARLSLCFLGTFLSPVLIGERFSLTRAPVGREPVPTYRAGAVYVLSLHLEIVKAILATRGAYFESLSG